MPILRVCASRSLFARSPLAGGAIPGLVPPSMAPTLPREGNAHRGGIEAPERAKGKRNRSVRHRRCMVVAGLVAGLAVLAGGVAQAAPVRAGHTQAELLAEVASVKPGQAFTVGLSLTPDPGWHTYWINPGDAGKPARIRWDAPEGLEFGELAFPAPGFVPFMGLMSYGYNEPTLLLAEATQIAPPAGAMLAIKARASWLVCDDKLCIPERADLSLEIPVADENPAAPPPAESESWRAAAFAEARALLPQPVGWSAAFHEAAGEVVFDLATPLSLEDAASLYLFPEAQGMIDHTAPQRIDIGSDRVRVAVPVGPRVARYQNTGLVLSMAMDGAPTQSFSLSAQRSDAPAEGDGGALLSMSVAPGGGADGGGGHGDAVGGGAALGGGAVSPAGFSAAAFWQAAVFAVLGGLILNLMPCVLPILSLKALGVAQMSGEKPAAARRSGLQYLAGVLASFLVFAALIIALRQAGEAVGWAFHMQNPLIVAALALLMVAVGLSLLGVFEVGSGLGALGGKAARGRSGEFFTGILAVLVATPCTAPFMAPALGYAIVQPPAATAAVFLALGLGFALPYCVVAFLPGARRLLPRPGAWMTSFRQALAFPMLATAIWLYWVLGNQAGIDALALALISALALGLAAFGWRRMAGEGVSRPWRAASVAALLVVAASLWALPRIAVAPGDAGPPAGEIAWSEAALGELRAEQRPVFAYFTADWCITCKVNERVALQSGAVKDFFARQGIQVMVGDWTNEDPRITEVLQRHGRAGVPLYLYFGSGASEALVLPQLLTPGLVIESIEAA